MDRKRQRLKTRFFHISSDFPVTPNMRPAVSGLYTTLMIIRQYLAIITDITNNLKAHRISDRHGLRGVPAFCQGTYHRWTKAISLATSHAKLWFWYRPNRAFCHIPRDITSLNVSQPQSYSRDDCFMFTSDDSSTCSLQFVHRLRPRYAIFSLPAHLARLCEEGAACGASLEQK